LKEQAAPQVVNNPRAAPLKAAALQSAVTLHRMALFVSPPLTFFEIANVLLRFDHVARCM